VFDSPCKILITCNRGLAPALERELSELGYPPQESLHTGVVISGTMRDCIRLNMRLRSASQVMASLRAFRCRDPEELYKNVQAIAWETLLDADGYFTVHGNVSHETIRSGMFANVKVKDAIVDRMRSKTGRRPDTGAELRGAVVYLFWRNDRAELFLDTSGETLAKHGYRTRPGKAPMVEALAAGTILVGHWDAAKMPFVNPMCGSGTVAIEAAQIATGRFPGLQRNNYAFMHLRGYDPNFYRAELKQLQAAIVDRDDLTIIATDISRQAVDIARANAEAAGVEGLIDFKVCDFADSPVPAEGGVIFFNPEYGERMGDASELTATYARIGDFMKQKCGGYWGYVFTANMDLAKKIGLKTKRRLEFATAQLDCRLLEFELYAGSRRAGQAN
jgi:putative N6-adenine-specific DNA methylase